MMHKSQFRNLDPYDWFCAPGGHIFDAKLNVSTFGKLYMMHIIAMHKQYILCFCVAEYYDRILCFTPIKM